MDKDSINYIAFYPCDIIGKKRIGHPAAKLQSDFLVQVLNEVGVKVELISPSQSYDTHRYFGIEKEFSVQQNEMFSIKYLTVIKTKASIIRRTIGYLYTLFWLLKKLGKEKYILFYHSMIFLPIYFFLHLMNIKFSIEVEEIYSDISMNKYLRKIELYCLHWAEAYILPNSMMAAEIARDKAWILYHGSCRNEPSMDKILPENVHHVVYAGTLDPRKMGDLPCVSSAEYLDNSFHIHILGVGFEENLKKVKKRAASLKEPHCPVTFHDVLYGDDYLSFLQSCDVGLYPQEATYEDINTSFPSKIMSYLSNGLRVVATRTKPLEMSEVADLLFFAESGSPENIAKAIKGINFAEPYNSRKRLDEIHERLQKDLRKLLFGAVE